MIALAAHASRERKTARRSRVDCPPNGAQLALPFRSHGGRRPGAGRPRVPSSGVSHRPRTRLNRHQPVHVTLRIRDGLPTLRQKRAFRAVHRAFVGGHLYQGFRLVHYSVQKNHLHLLVEAPNAEVLARALQGLSVRLARRLNATFEQRGRLFADRYHARVLKSPREVRLALRYVLSNARRHLAPERGRHLPGWVDPYSSAPFFAGWREHTGRPPVALGEGAARAGPLGRDDPRCVANATPETAPAASYLLTRGWRRDGLLSTREVPGPTF